MFQDLDNTIQAVLHDGSAPSELRNADVSFETPDRNFNPQTATVNLFLYDLQENRELRDPVPIVDKVGDAFVRRTPPLRVECTYLVTTWAHNLAGPNRVAAEHQLLAQSLLWLSRFPTIPDLFFAGGGLADPRFPPPTLVAQMDANKNAGEFWTALGTAPRPAFHLTVTIALDLGVQVPLGPPVTTRFTGVAPGFGTTAERMVQIGGRVLGSQTGVVRAQVNLVNAANAQATLPSAGAAANFRPGDLVLLAQNNTLEQAVIAGIAGATVTFERGLSNTFTGGTLRIADLVVTQRSIRLNSTADFLPGSSVRITQVPISEEAIVQTVDPVRNSITLAKGLFNTYTMAANDAPVNVTPAIAGAVVDVVDAGLQTQSTDDGHFSFVRVPAGTHTVRVAATGYQVKTQALNVPGLPENYEITLAPLP